MLSLYMIILFAVFSPAMCTETCPEAEAIYPCKCRELLGTLVVECYRDSMETLQQVLKSFIGKNSVRLSLERLSINIPSDFFAGVGIEKLEFYSCRIDSLATDDRPVLLGLENHLKELRIYSSPTVLATLSVGHLKKLTQISLNRNNIRELGDDWFSNGPSSLKFLYITENNITKIGSKAFSRLNNLLSLELEDNRFIPIERGMLPTTADRLRILFLNEDFPYVYKLPQFPMWLQTMLDTRSPLCKEAKCRRGVIDALFDDLLRYGYNNGLTDLPVDFFSKMPSLSTVLLNRNEITTLDERTWSPVWQQLMSISLYDNKLVCDDRMKWIIKSGKWPSVVLGKCSAPKEFEGMDLVEFFKNRK